MNPASIARTSSTNASCRYSSGTVARSRVSSSRTREASRSQACQDCDVSDVVPVSLLTSPLPEPYQWLNHRSSSPQDTASGLETGPGGPGRLPAQGSHRPVRAQLAHSVPQVMPSLRDGRPSEPPRRTAGDSAAAGVRTSRTSHATPAAAEAATSARAARPHSENGRSRSCCP